MFWLFFVLMLAGSENKKTDNDDSFDGEVFCQIRKHLITSNGRGEVLVAEGSSNSSILLKCSYCGEDTTREARVWFKKNIRSGMLEEVKLDSRVEESFLRSLVVRNLSRDDAGVYLCRLIYEDSLRYSYNYLVDIITGNEGSEPVTGQLADWLNYSQQYLMPKNSLLTDMEPSYYYLNSTLFKFEVVSSWSPWSECEICVENPIQWTTAHCRIIPKLVMTPSSDLSFNPTQNIWQKSSTSFLLETGGELPCRGSLLHDIFPEIFAVVKGIPDFRQEVSCAPSCPSKGGKKGPMERRLLVLKEDGRAIIPCPGMIHNVLWEYNKRRIEPDSFTDEVSVDHFGNLHLVAISSSASGNYTCIDKEKDVQVLEVKLVVESSTIVLSSAFYRHAVYLAQVCILSSLIFTIVLFGAYWRRRRIVRRKPKNRWNRDKKIILQMQDDTEEEEN